MKKEYCETCASWREGDSHCLLKDKWRPADDGCDEYKKDKMEYTVQNILDLNLWPDYDLKTIEKLWGGRLALSQREIAGLDIPAMDRMWALCKLLWRDFPSRSRKLSRMIALDVADLWYCPDIVWWYLVSGDESARDAAREAADRAAWEAAWEAAWYADSYAAMAAWAAWYASDAARAARAAWEAARTASDAWDASDAAWAARAVAWNKYLQWTVKAFGCDL